MFSRIYAGLGQPPGQGRLVSARGIEIGHIFQLGRKYAEALDLKVLDENGKLVTVTMGSYGIGPSRGVAAIDYGIRDPDGLRATIARHSSDDLEVALCPLPSKTSGKSSSGSQELSSCTTSPPGRPSRPLRACPCST